MKVRFISNKLVYIQNGFNNNYVNNNQQFIESDFIYSPTELYSNQYVNSPYIYMSEGQNYYQ
jgi:hypothetical protein